MNYAWIDPFSCLELEYDNNTCGFQQGVTSHELAHEKQARIPQTSVDCF